MSEHDVTRKGGAKHSRSDLRSSPQRTEAHMLKRASLHQLGDEKRHIVACTRNESR
jgi:hypothetical protein